MERYSCSLRNVHTTTNIPGWRQVHKGLPRTTQCSFNKKILDLTTSKGLTPLNWLRILAHIMVPHR